ncbi:MAG: DUF4340 domain-containing protein [Acidobacteria bacterium]|nr:DUF4340 domain-containing protein [Acidobacteriota bacterium]
MRRGRSFLLMLVVAAGLGAYIYFVEMKRDPAADTATAAREKVFTIATGAIEEVEVTNASAEVTRATRTDTTWALVVPEAAEADTIAVSTLVSSIESLERVKVIDDTPASLEPFGLAPARIRIAFKVAGDPAAKTLLIGNKTPTGGDLYAKVGDAPAVFLIGGFLEDTFNKTPFDLREKSVLKFALDGVDALALAQGPARISLSKTGGDWRFTAPLAANADAAAVDALVNRLFQAKMTRLSASGAAARLKEFGLDKPKVVVTVASGSSRAELAIGADDDDTNVFARDLARPLVFSVEKTLVDELLKTADDYRVKDAFAFRSFTAQALDIAFGGKTYSFAKKMGEGENAADTWSQTAPEAKAVDEAKFSDLLMTISNLRAESFAAAALTGGESITVTARFGDAAAPQTETVTLRKAGAVAQAIRAGEPGAAVVSTADFDRAMGLFRELTGAK